MTDDISSDKQRFAQKRVVKPFPKVAARGSYFFTLGGTDIPIGYGHRMRISSPVPLESAVDQPIKQTSRKFLLTPFTLYIAKRITHQKEGKCKCAF